MRGPGGATGSPTRPSQPARPGWWCAQRATDRALPARRPGAAPGMTELTDRVSRLSLESAVARGMQHRDSGV